MRCAVKTYDFSLTFSLPSVDEDPSIHEKALWDNGCDDALIGIGRRGSIGLMFAREAESAYQAVFSAISAVKRSIPGSALTEVEPDFVGITDIAELVDRSRQNIRKLIYADDSKCPPPAHSGNPALWHLYDVLKWLQQAKNYEISHELIEVAAITKSLNALRVWNQIEPNGQEQAQEMESAKPRLNPIPVPLAPASQSVSKQDLHA